MDAGEKKRFRTGSMATRIFSIDVLLESAIQRSKAYAIKKYKYSRN